MILEQAVLDVRPGRSGEFEAAFSQAKAVISAVPGFRRLTPSRGVERPDTYLLLVQWDTLEDHTDVTYQVSQFYTPAAERGIRYDDPALGIRWPLEVQVISEKDRSWPRLDA